MLPTRARTWLRRVAIVVAGLGALLLVLAAVLHTAPVREIVLRRASLYLADRFDLALDASSLDYSLLAGRVSLSHAALASPRTREAPFLTADLIDVTVPLSALFGTVAVERIRLENARVTLHRRGDAWNLPSGGPPGDDAPPSALNIGRLEIPRLAVAVIDDASRLSASLPNLSVDIRSDAGQLRLVDEGRLALGTEAATIKTLGGGVAFNGRAIRLSQFAAVTDDADMTLNGEVALLVSQPYLDVRLSGSGEVPGLARWATPESVPDGTVSVVATVTGPLSSPTVASRLRSEALSYRGMTFSKIDVDLNVDASRLLARRIEMALAGGQVTAGGDLTFASGDATVKASWTDVSVEQLGRTLAGSDSTLPAGRAAGQATFTGVPSDAATWMLDVANRVTATAASSGRLPIAGELSLGVNQGLWRLEGMHDVAGAGVRTSLSGVIDPDDLPGSTLTGSVEAKAPDVSRVIAALEASQMIERPSEVAGQLDVLASVSGSFERPAFRVSATGQGLSAFDVPELAIDATADGDLQRAVVEARVRQGHANTVQISGTVWPDEARLDARVEGTVGDLSVVSAGTAIEGAARLRLDAQGPFRAIVARGTVSIADGRYEGVPLGPLDATIELDSGTARADVTAPDFGATARADLRIEAPRSGTVDLQVTDAQVDRVLRAAGLQADIAGAISLTAHADGTLDDWRHAAAAIDVGAFSGRAGSLPIRLREPARAAYDGGTLEVASLEAALGETSLSISGRYAVLDDAPAVAPSDALRGVLLGDLAHLADALRASGLADRVDVAGTGPVVVLTRVNGAGQQPLVSADVEVGPAEVSASGLPPFHGLQARARVADGWAELVSASGDWQESKITARGRLPLHFLGERVPDGLFASSGSDAGLASVDVRATSVTSQALASFLPPESIAEIDGAIDATVHLEAPSLDWASLGGEVRLDRLDLTVAGVGISQQEPTRVVIEKGIARLESWRWSGRGTTLVMQGEVRLTDRRAAVLAGGQLDLRLLTPFVSAADIAIAGSVVPHVSVSGPLDDLRIEGDVTVADGELRLREPGIIVTGLTATALLDRDRARITSVDAQINGGTLKGSGDVGYRGPDGLSGTMATTITGMGLEFPEGLRSEIDADLSLALAREGEELAGTLSGTATVTRSAYREPIAVITRMLTALRTERLAAVAPTERTFADRLRLNVRLVTDSDVIVDNNLARLQLGADLRVIGTAAAPALSGRATLREGGELFIGRNQYTIASGSIDFANPVTIEPNLNVQAETRAGGEDIELTLKGTPDTLSVDLRSTSAPELGQPDIASLLLTGRPLSEVSGAEAEIVGEQVLGYLSGDVLGAASRVVGLDTLRLGAADTTLFTRDSAEIASETDPTSRLTFGKSLGPFLEVTLSQSLRDNGAQTWILDYRPIQRADLRFVSDDDNLRSYQFRHDVTIGNRVERAPRPSRDARDVPRVAAVTLAGELGGSEDRLRRVLELEPGEEFDFSVWQRDRDRLERALREEGRLEATVSARRQDAANGVAVTYQIDAGPLTVIRFTGYSPSQDLRQAVEAAWSRAIFDDALVSEVEGLVGRALTERGYRQPSVMASVATEGTTKALDIAVEPGERASERRLSVGADDEALGRDLERWARRGGVEDMAWRDPPAFRRALVDELRKRGHVAPEVTVAPPQADGSAAVVRVDVRAGPVVTVRDVRFTGDGGVAPDRLREAAAIEQDAPYDPTGIDQARDRVVRALRGEGYAAARVEATVDMDPGGRQLTVVFAVDQGPRQVLREIAVNGNRSIDRDVIVRALELKTGDALGVEAWLRARSRLFDTALFRRVDVSAEPISEAAGGEQAMRLLVTVEEWPALRVRYGGQLSEERPEGDLEGRTLAPGLSADVTRRTLFGRAVTVGGAAAYQRHRRGARVFLNTPTLFGLPVESLLSVDRSREDIADASVVTDRNGISWEQRAQIRTPLRVSYGYRYDRDHTFSARPSNDPLNPSFDVTVDVARLTGAVVFDTRNNPLDATRGWLASSNFEYAPASLGSDIRFIRYLAQAYRFQTLGRVVLASAGRLGLATALDGQSLIPSERFFGGGARTVRGVRENGLGPRDFFGDAAGGGALVVFNQEVRVPIYGWFGGVTFVDVGNVFEGPRAIDFGDLVGSFGAGLRVNTPFALLRADVARLWLGNVGQPTARWTFGIGHTF